MPTELEDIIFPVVYQPWYFYEVTLVASPADFDIGDVMFPDSSGNFDRLETDAAVLTTGYVFALEAFDTENPQTSIQAATPGSLMPFPADNTLTPCCLVKFQYSGGLQKVTIASAADLAAGKVIGRFRNHHNYNQVLRITVADDIVDVLTGAV